MTIRSFINLGESLGKVAGINISIGDTVDISYCVLSQKKDVISVIASGHGVPGYGELIARLKEHLPQGSRVHVNFEGKGILSKTFDTNEPVADHVRLVNKFFPIVRAEDFAVQIGLGTGKNFLSIARKDILQQPAPINDFYNVVSVTFGAAVVSHILPLINTDRVELRSCTIESRDGRISEILPGNDNVLKPVAIGSENIAADSVIAYSSALSLLISKRNISVFNVDDIHANAIRFDFNKHLYRASRIALFAVISVLFINTVAYLSLQSKITEAEATLLFSSGQHEARGKEQQQMKALVASHDKLGWKSNVQPIYYCDQIALRVSDAIALTNLEVGVLDNDLLKKEKQVSYEAKTIKVQGIAADPVSLKEWIETIEKLYWIDEIYDEKYQHDKKLKKGIFEFYIRIK